MPTIPDLTIPLKVNTDIAKINTLEELYHTLETVSNQNYSQHNTPEEDTRERQCKVSNYEDLCVRKLQERDSAKCKVSTTEIGVLENYSPHKTPKRDSAMCPTTKIGALHVATSPHLNVSSPSLHDKLKIGWKSWILNCAPRLLDERGHWEGLIYYLTILSFGFALHYSSDSFVVLCQTDWPLEFVILIAFVVVVV